MYECAVIAAEEVCDDYIGIYRTLSLEVSSKLVLVNFWYLLEANAGDKLWQRSDANVKMASRVPPIIAT